MQCKSPFSSLTQDVLRTSLCQKLCAERCPSIPHRWERIPGSAEAYIRPSQENLGTAGQPYDESTEPVTASLVKLLLRTFGGRNLTLQSGRATRGFGILVLINCWTSSSFKAAGSVGSYQNLINFTDWMLKMFIVISLRNLLRPVTALRITNRHVYFFI